MVRRILFAPVLAVSLAAAVAQAHPTPPPQSPPTDFTPPADERLGTVSFAQSCAPRVRASFDRGIALLHDFWYDEARPQFERIVAAYPACAMAHWGVAMSLFHQIWDRPDETTMATGWAQMQAALAHPAKTAREREYVAALSDFFKPDAREYAARITAYATAMGALYRRQPTDVDAGAFYALALLAAEAPDDTSLSAERSAMTVLRPLFVKAPDNPGVVHYIIHACDTPSLAPEALTAANHYGVIAASGPHAVHMPGHIYARLGMWQADIDANRASVAASHAAEARHMSGSMDQFHSDDFLLYAYLQSGQDDNARTVLGDAAAALAHFESMPNMSEHYMTGMIPYYKTKLPSFYALEMRDWRAAAALGPIAGAPPESQILTFWARAAAHGHLHDESGARADLAGVEALIEKLRQGRHAYFADSTGARVILGEMRAWISFAAGDTAEAVTQMRGSADLQDKVGQGEVDIPAREMLGDILRESHQPKAALTEYQGALQLSPGRFNGLYGAGQAAEASGDELQARELYAALLKSTGGGAQSARAELAHAKAYAAAPATAYSPAP